MLTTTGKPAVTTFKGDAYLFGNTEERLKYLNLGSPERGTARMGKFDHATACGHVPRKMGAYFDAIHNRKARVRLLCHEIFGGMSGYAARRLRRLAREAAANGTDRTDYTRSHTARSFVPYYAQRISFSIVMNGAKSILKTLAKASRSRLRSAA